MRTIRLGADCLGKEPTLTGAEANTLQFALATGGPRYSKDTSRFRWVMLSIFVQMGDAQHFAEDLSCCSVFSPSSANNQYHQVSSWNGDRETTAGICVIWICSNYGVMNLIKKQALQAKCPQPVCLHLPLAIWYASLNFETVFIRRVKCISILHQAPPLIFMTSASRFI